MSKKNIVIALTLTFISGFILCGVIFYFYFGRVSQPVKNEDIKNSVSQPTIVENDKFDATKFDGVNRAAKKIEASTSVGINYQQFGELLQNLATEILITRDKLTTDKERSILAQYTTIVDAYKDSHLLWQYKIEDHSKGDVWAMENVIVVRPDMVPIISQYNIAERKVTDFSLISADSIKDIWLKAHTELEKTTALLQRRT